MSKLRFLTNNEIQIISAGEVVERPASIIKELIENSIDANSSFIKVNLINGGKDLIEILDDGIGMSEGDLKIAILPHTTSKVSDISFVHDGKIDTYGFRGEALSSIAAISNMTIVSKQRENDFATKIFIKNGNVESLEKTSGSNGTYIKIENIFESVPARRKFLKKNEREWSASENTIIGMMISAIGVGFLVKSNTKNVFELSQSESIIDRCRQIVKYPTSDFMIECNYSNDLILMKGLISNIEYGYYDRSKIFVNINNRYVKQYKITQSVIKGYGSGLLQYRFPAAYLSIKVDQGLVDVNVHPRKEEVAFSTPQKIENSIIKGVIETLNKEKDKVFSFSNLNEKVLVSASDNFCDFEGIELNVDTEGFEGSSEENIQKPLIEDNFKSNSEEYNLNHVLPARKEDIRQNIKSVNFELKKEIPKNESCSKGLIFREQYKLFDESKTFANSFIGIFAKTYLLFDRGENLLFVDQHAIHEKIIYNQLIVDYDNLVYQKLIFPISIILDSSTMRICIGNYDVFKFCGIELEELSGSTIVIRSCSKLIDKCGIRESFDLLLNYISSGLSKELAKIDLIRKVVGDIACKKAIRAGDKISEDQVKLLINNAYAYSETYQCPHGRPTYHSMNISNIEKMFSRN
jgi:DNA mismatch repair protein MutL